LALKRRAKKLLVAAGVLLTLFVAFEGAFRFLLFAPLARQWGLGWRLRNEALFSPREAGREAWVLAARLDGRHSRVHPNADGRLGWIKPAIERASLAHADEECLRGRRPVLLFGDSYAQCVGSAGICWEGLLEESELSERFRLLNYGVGGYGLDQVRLLLGLVLERHAAADPLVVVSILVDDDLDRSYLGLRSFPKPRFTVEGGGLVHHPLEELDTGRYLARHPLRIGSYLWRWMQFGTGALPRSWCLAWHPEADHVAAKERVNRLLLQEIVAELELRGLDFFFLLFHARKALEAPRLYGWQEPFLVRTLAELGAPFVSSKTPLRAYMARTGESSRPFYFDSGPGLNHYTALGNEVVFEALRSGLEGRFEPTTAR
jgi:hypothetical protein